MSETIQHLFPESPEGRKQHPVCTGFLDYFPAAIAQVAHVSWRGNQQHNPGEPLHWARGKSMDQLDCIMRHLMDARAAVRAGQSPVQHLAQVCWRALAETQLACEAEGAPRAPAARDPNEAFISGKSLEEWMSGPRQRPERIRPENMGVQRTCRCPRSLVSGDRIGWGSDCPMHNADGTAR